MATTSAKANTEPLITGTADDVSSIDEVRQRAASQLVPLRRASKSRQETLKLYKGFIRSENQRTQDLHAEGAGGIETARRRSDLIDVVLDDLFEAARKSASSQGDKKVSEHPITLIANGGYGRGLLNPGSDIDLLFLHADPIR